MDHLTIAKQLDIQRAQVVDQAVVMALQNPFWMARFGSGISERLSLDFDLNLAALAKAIRYRSPMIFDDHVIWRRNQIVGFGCASGHLREIFGYKWAAISALLPAEMLPTIYDHIQSGMQSLIYPAAGTQQLAAAHEQLAERLTAASFDQSWHWQAAYSADGRTASLHDNWFLIDYAIDAIGARNPDILGRYVRHQRDANYARGLSSIHMQQLLWLATEAAEQGVAPSAAADLRRVMEAAAGFLAHDSEACHALMSAQDQIVQEVAEQLMDTGMAPRPEYAAMEIGWYLAYLNDSLARQDATCLIGYTRWMQHYFADQGLPDTPLRQSYSAIASAAERYLPQYAAIDVRAILNAAQQAL